MLTQEVKINNSYIILISTNYITLKRVTSNIIIQPVYMDVVVEVLNTGFC